MTRAGRRISARSVAAHGLCLLLAAACGEGARGTGDSGAGAPAGRAVVQIGAPIPAYAARSLEGDSVSLEGLRDRVVLLNVWATWCHPCRAEIPELQALHTRYAPRGLSIVGVSIDASDADASIREFMREFGMTYPIWRDPDERVSARFLVLGVPATFLIDRGGVLRWRMTGPIRPGDTTLVKAIERALGE